MRREYASLSHGLVGAWCPSLGITGYRLIDRSGRNNHGVFTNMDGQANWGASGGGLYVNTDGVNDIIDTGSSLGMNGATFGTISVWFFTSASITKGSVGFANGLNNAGGNRFEISLVSGAAYFTAESDSSGAVYPYFSIPSGWIHLAMVYDGTLSFAPSRIAAFLNGTQQVLNGGGAPIPSSLGTSLGNFLIGKSATDAFSGGRYDDVRIWNRRLTSQEIKILASRRGIGLTPYRQRRTSASSKRLWANIGGTWKETVPYINVGGTWKEAAVYRHDGTGFKN